MTRRLARPLSGHRPLSGLVAVSAAAVCAVSAVPARPGAALAAVPASVARTAVTPTAGWSSPATVQPGIGPVLSFGPTGAAALGSETYATGRASRSYVDLAPAAGAFAAHPWELDAPSAGAGPEPLAGLALSSTGDLAALFAGRGGTAPVLARVTAGAPANFGSPQRLIAMGGAARSQAVPVTATLLASTQGEIVGAGTDDTGVLSTATLTPRRTRFVTGRGPAGLTASDAYGLASDPGGDTLLAGDGPTGCTGVAFRAPRGQFRRTYATSNCSSATPNVYDAITATTGARAALLTEDVSEAGTAPNRLFIQVGRAGHFARATQLAAALGGPVGLASDADGEVTAEWTGCDAGPLRDGRLSLDDCAIDASTGSAVTGFGARPVAGATLTRAAAHSTLTAVTADRAVGISRCSGSRCALVAFTARPRGGFRAAHPLATASAKLIAFTSDNRGNLLAVWRDTRGRLLAATGSAATGSWSAGHLLSAQPVDASEVSASYGPQGRAIVAWSRADRIFAASFTR